MSMIKKFFSIFIALHFALLSASPLFSYERLEHPVISNLYGVSSPLLLSAQVEEGLPKLFWQDADINGSGEGIEMGRHIVFAAFLNALQTPDSDLWVSLQPEGGDYCGAGLEGTVLCNILLRYDILMKHDVRAILKDAFAADGFYVPADIDFEFRVWGFPEDIRIIDHAGRISLYGFKIKADIEGTNVEGGGTLPSELADMVIPALENALNNAERYRLLRAVFSAALLAKAIKRYNPGLAEALIGRFAGANPMMSQLWNDPYVDNGLLASVYKYFLKRKTLSGFLDDGDVVFGGFRLDQPLPKPVPGGENILPAQSTTLEQAGQIQDADAPEKGVAGAIAKVKIKKLELLGNNQIRVVYSDKGADKKIVMSVQPLEMKQDKKLERMEVAFDNNTLYLAEDEYGLINEIKEKVKLQKRAQPQKRDQPLNIRLFVIKEPPSQPFIGGLNFFSDDDNTMYIFLNKELLINAVPVIHELMEGLFTSKRFDLDLEENPRGQIRLSMKGYFRGKYTIPQKYEEVIEGIKQYIEKHTDWRKSPHLKARLFTIIFMNEWDEELKSKIKGLSNIKSGEGEAVNLTAEEDADESTRQAEAAAEGPADSASPGDDEDTARLRLQEEFREAFSPADIRISPEGIYRLFEGQIRAGMMALNNTDSLDVQGKKRLLENILKNKSGHMGWQWWISLLGKRDSWPGPGPLFERYMKFVEEHGNTLGRMDERQRFALFAMLSPEVPVAIVEGLPGGGKTELLATAVNEDIQNGRRVAVLCATHRAVDEVLERAIAKGVHPDMVFRAGNQLDKVSDQMKSRALSVIPDFSIKDLSRGPFVLGGTSDGAYLDNKLEGEKIDVDTLYIDEASLMSIIEGVGIPSLLKSLPPKVVLIGDRKQLSPFYARTSGSALRGIMDVAAEMNAGPVIRLNTTYRHNHILASLIGWLNGEKIRCGRAFAWREWVDSLQNAIEFQTIEARETSDRGYVSNKAAVEVGVSLIKELAEKGQGRTIAVLTPYQEQNRLYWDRLNEEHIKCDLATIDSAQGREWDTVVLDLTRTDNPGFLVDVRRLYVALSRAENKLVIIGNPERLLEKEKNEEFRDFLLRLLVFKNAVEDLRGLYNRQGPATAIERTIFTRYGAYRYTVDEEGMLRIFDTVSEKILDGILRSSGLESGIDALKRSAFEQVVVSDEAGESPLVRSFLGASFFLAENYKGGEGFGKALLKARAGLLKVYGINGVKTEEDACNVIKGLIEKGKADLVVKDVLDAVKRLSSQGEEDWRIAFALALPEAIVRHNAYGTDGDGIGLFEVSAAVSVLLRQELDSAPGVLFEKEQKTANEGKKGGFDLTRLIFVVEGQS